MSRFPALIPTPGENATYDYLVDITTKTYGDIIVTEDPDGSL